jgi:hypothetical protein
LIGEMQIGDEAEKAYEHLIDAINTKHEAMENAWIERKAQNKKEVVYEKPFYSQPIQLHEPQNYAGNRANKEP